MRNCFFLKYLGKYYFLLKRRFHGDLKVYFFTELHSKFREFILICCYLAKVILEFAAIRFLGVLFDNQLNISDYFNKLVSVCYTVISEIWGKSIG